MNFYKTLLAFAIALSVFSSNVFSMQDDLFAPDLEFGNGPHTSPYKTSDQPEEKTDKSYSHWGLSHWFSGIEEYIQTCLCCTVRKEEGLYRHTIQHDTYLSSGSIGREEPRTTVVISDCFFNYFTTYDRDPRRCDKAICCFPFAVITHLCCLPSACCKMSKSDPEEVFHVGQTHYPSYQPQYSILEKERARDFARGALEYKHSPCTCRTCIFGQPNVCPKRT
jgi:hypothetical protein